MTSCIMFKRQLFSAALFFLSIISFGQTFLPLIEIGKKWNEYGYLYPDGQWTVYYYFGNDTVINDLGYVKLLQDSNIPDATINLAGFLRENAGGQVYFIPSSKNGQSTQNEEYLLYDFASQPGDTVEVYSEEWTGSCLITIDSVVSADYSNITRNKYYYHLLEGSWETSFWVEGLGSSFGLLSTCDATIDAGSYLLCVSKDTSLLYFNEEIYYTCEAPSTVSISEHFTDETPAIIPNPNDGNFMLKSGINEEFEFQLYNLLGELVADLFVSTNSVIDLSSYYGSSGMLIYMIRKDHQVINTGKMIVN